jgi:hypothetical protein
MGWAEIIEEEKFMGWAEIIEEEKFMGWAEILFIKMWAHNRNKKTIIDIRTPFTYTHTMPPT